MLEERQIRKANRLENRVEQLKEVAQAAKENDRLPNEEVKRKINKTKEAIEEILDELSSIKEFTLSQSGELGEDKIDLIDQAFQRMALKLEQANTVLEED